MGRILIVILGLATAFPPGQSPEDSAPTAGPAAAGATLESMRPYTEKAGAASLDLVPIPVGREGFPEVFWLGSPPEEAKRGEDEGPRRRVKVEPFWIGRVEVTWDLYDEFRREYALLLDRRLEKSDTPPEKWGEAVSIPTPLWEQDSAPILAGLGQSGGYPAADITQFAAMQFTKWLSKRTGRFYRLPTEAEWEYAARAGTDTAYFFGDDPSDLAEYAWTFDNSAYDDPDQGYPGVGAGYRRVGTKKPSPWGLHDVYGNVAEWVIDAYAADAYAALEGDPVPWRDAVRWPRKIYPCVARGGSWESDPEACRSAARLASSKRWQRRDPQIPRSIWWCTDAFHVGFRVVRPLKEPGPEEKLRFWDGEIPAIQRVLERGQKELRVPLPAKKETSR